MEGENAGLGGEVRGQREGEAGLGSVEQGAIVRPQSEPTFHS